MKQMSGSRLFMIAVVCGVIAAFLMIYYLKSMEERYRRAHQPAVVEKVAVVVPRRNLNKGDPIVLDAIGRLEVPRQYLPTNYIPASDYRDILNRTLASPVQAGRIMTEEAVTGTKADTFSETIDLGRRAFSLKVNKVDSFDGLLRPGDTIDLLGEFDLEDLGVMGTDDENNQVVMPVLERVEVLSAGREDHTGRRYERTNAPNSADGFNMEFTIVTLNLTPRQVARVELAQATGSLIAILRHPEDTSVAGFDYLRADILLEPEPEETLDVVLDADGNPIGRIIGDNIVDSQGNIIGKVVDGKAVAFDGTPLGTIVENVSADDPMLRVRERADVVRDAQGNVIGKIVDGKIVDRAGNVIGHVDADGNAVGMDGQILGRVEKNVALDAQGNVVDLRDSTLQPSRAQTVQVVRDKDGNVIGRVVDGNIVDASGRVIGRVDESGQAVSLSGEKLGTVEEAMVDRDGNIIGRAQEVVRDKHGNIIGRVVDGQIINDKGEVVGHVDASGRAVGLDGEVIGRTETVMVDDNGKILGEVAQVVRDAQGNIIGRVVDGQVVNERGEVIGRVNADGSVTGLDGEVLGQVEQAILGADGQELGEMAQVVRDAEGNIIGRLVDGKVIDAQGNVVGELKDGKIVDASGRTIASGVSVSTEDSASINAQLREQAERKITREVDYIEFIPGGTGKEGIVPVRRIRLQ